MFIRILISRDEISKVPLRLNGFNPERHNHLPDNR